MILWSSWACNWMRQRKTTSSLLKLMAEWRGCEARSWSIENTSSAAREEKSVWVNWLQLAEISWLQWQSRR